MNGNNLVSDGLLVVKRTDYWHDDRYAAEKIEPSIFMETKQIFSQYCGIDGEAWPLEMSESNILLIDGLSSIDYYQEILSYYELVKKSNLCDLIYITSCEAILPKKLQAEGWTFCGYDYGMYLGEHNNWSVIFQEIIFGKLSELREFGHKLNNNLLLSSLEEAFNLRVKRGEIAKTENSVFLETIEEDEDFGPIAIYSLKVR
jgi:hypothetical protein